jgi:hypothetical protein
VFTEHILSGESLFWCVRKIDCTKEICPLFNCGKCNKEIKIGKKRKPLKTLYKTEFKIICSTRKSDLGSPR